MVDGDAAGGAWTWDFFISYTAADRGWAEWVAWQLEDAGHRVLIQAWDFVPGSDWMYGMEEGVTHARRMIALLSAAYLKSVYGGEEWRAVRAADPQGFARKLLPVRIEECDRPGLLRTVVGFDLFDRERDAARDYLLEQIGHSLIGRAKPAVAPEFPVPRRPAPPVAEPDFPQRGPRRGALATLTGHALGVEWGGFSPDGTLLATASHDRTARLWDVPTGRARVVLTGHTDRVTWGAFSPDGTLLATGSDDTSARLWDAPTGRAWAVLTDHTDAVWWGAFSPDGPCSPPAPATGRCGCGRSTELVLQSRDIHDPVPGTLACLGDGRLDPTFTKVNGAVSANAQLCGCPVGDTSLTTRSYPPARGGTGPEDVACRL